MYIDRMKKGKICLMVNGQIHIKREIRLGEEGQTESIPNEPGAS